MIQLFVCVVFSCKSKQTAYKEIVVELKIFTYFMYNCVSEINYFTIRNYDTY